MLKFEAEAIMRRNKAESDQTRRAILDSAEALFLSNGVSRTTLEMIAREGGFTRGAVYWHFRDKSHLVHEMLDQIRMPMYEVIHSLTDEYEGDCIVKLFEMCVEHMDRFTRAGPERRIMTIFMHRCDFALELQDVIERRNTLARDFVVFVEKIFARNPHRLQVGVTPKLASLQLHSFFGGILAANLRHSNGDELHIDGGAALNIYFNAIIRDWRSH